jgi:hypothetical protein
MLGLGLRIFSKFISLIICLYFCLHKKLPQTQIHCFIGDGTADKQTESKALFFFVCRQLFTKPQMIHAQLYICVLSTLQITNYVLFQENP